MLRTYTHDEMLRLWRIRAGLEPSRSDCTVEAVEGIDADALIASRMRPWYLHLLDTAEASLLPVADVAPDLTVVPAPDGGSATSWLPAKVRRLLELRLSGWSAPAVPCAAAAGTPRLRLALNPYCAPGAAHPLCAADGPRLHIRPYQRGWTVAAALAVVDPGADTYTLDESLLSTIPETLMP